jgi:tRNA(Arg) A34 adenosine deaminase TadA
MTGHDALLTRTFELAAEARAAGDHPFGALFAVGDAIVAEARNRVNTDVDITAHAETHLVRVMERQDLFGRLSEGKVYASCEPCPMCVGAMFWAGVRHVVYGLSAERLMDLARPPGIQPMGFGLTAHTLGASATPPMHFDGPHREDDAAVPHLGFWTP